jgi:NAD(P)-dependent dehydrogenase (short-subunit alcohol dehydrogenase family)
MRLLDGRTAFVTGAARGIGRSVAERFSRHGATVVLADVDSNAVARAAQDITQKTGNPTLGLTVDVADALSVRSARTAAEAAFGVSDIVVANAGILTWKPALDLTLQEFERVLRINLIGAFLTATTFARPLVDAGRTGQLIFTSSLFGLRGGVNNAAYSASKFGVIGLAESMAAELAPCGIRVNSVCPGQIDSEMLERMFVDRATETGRSADDERRAFEEKIAMGRLGSADEVADTFVYLASELSSYTTGQHLVVDGGWTVR